MRLAAIALSSTLFAVTTPAVAEPTMRDAMHEYFAGELAEGWVFAGIGAAGLAGGATGAAVAKDGAYHGAAWPLLTIGAIQLAAGVVLLFRTDRQVAERDDMLATKPHAFFSLERPRMTKVRSEFTWLAIAEGALVAVGAGLAAYGGARGDHFVFGIGGGLAIESALMLVLDGRASARADVYSAAMDRWSR